MILSEDRASQVEPAILLFRAYLETGVFNNSAQSCHDGLPHAQHRPPGQHRCRIVEIMNGNTDVDLADIFF